jgi:hypothetical protein
MRPDRFQAHCSWEMSVEIASDRRQTMRFPFTFAAACVTLLLMILTAAAQEPITGNMLDLGCAHNLLVEKSRDIVVGPNVLARVDYTYGTCPEARTALVFRDCQDCTFPRTGNHTIDVENAFRDNSV